LAYLILHNFPLANERGLFIPEINLIVQTVRLVDDRLTASTILPPCMLADFVADFEFAWCWVGLLGHGGILQSW
jgi:hypothetical protein